MWLQLLKWISRRYFHFNETLIDANDDDDGGDDNDDVTIEDDDEDDGDCAATADDEGADDRSTFNALHNNSAVIEVQFLNGKISMK